MSVDSAISNYPEGWALTTLGEVCKKGGGEIQTGPFGSQLHAADYVIDGIPSIMSKNISVEGISTDDIARITEEDAVRLSKYRVTTGDIVYSRRGDVEKCAVVSATEDGWLCGTGCLRVRLGDDAAVSPFFIHAYLSHPEVREWICRHAVGATMPNLNTSILSALPVLIPSPEEMEAVEKLWASTISKVVLNRQISQTLEQIVQAIFKSWFIDFEPVKAKQHIRTLGGNEEQTERAAQAIVAGAVNLGVVTTATDLNTLDQQLTQALNKKLAHQTDAQRKQLAIAARHFPDQLVNSELELIPAGWMVSNIGQEFDVVMGQSPPGDTYNEAGLGRPFFQGRRDFGWRYPKNRVYCTQPKRTASKGDSLLSVRAPVGDVNKAITDCCIGRGLSALRHKSGCEAFTYYSVMSLDRSFRSFDSEGTVFGSINQKDLRALKIVSPKELVLNEFSRTAGLIDRAIRYLDNQNRSLVAARDNLLPKLLSGEAGVPNTNEQATEVT